MRWRRRRRQNEPMKCALDGGVCLNAMYHGVLVHMILLLSFTRIKRIPYLHPPSWCKAKANTPNKANTPRACVDPSCVNAEQHHRRVLPVFAFG